MEVSQLEEPYRRGEMRQIGTDDQGTCSGLITQESKPRILVADDDHHVATVIRDILLHEGYEVEIARSGRQALEFLKSGKDLDLMITDMRMPEMDGLELLRQVRKTDRDLPVIVLTGYATVEDGLEAIGRGIIQNLSKPFDVKELTRAVHAVLKDKA